MVAQREATRFTITGSNVTKAKMLESFNAELSNSLFTSIELAAKTNAPLLVKKLKRDHRVVLESPTRLMVDAQNVLTLTHNLISSKLSRHITRRELIVREREVEGHHTVTKTDLLTKALDPIPFDKLRRLVLNILAVGAIYPVPRARRIATKAWRNV